jgi:hypothetical protein
MAVAARTCRAKLDLCKDCAVGEGVPSVEKVERAARDDAAAAEVRARTKP